MKLKRWLRGWIIAGLVPPSLYLAIYTGFNCKLGEGIFVFWPAAMGLMVLENQPPIAMVVLIWAITIAANVILYTVIGLLLWPNSNQVQGPFCRKGRMIALL